MSILPASFGIAYWGIVLSAVLFGITILQGWIYLHNNRDGWPLRGMVSFMMLAEIVTAGLIAQAGYYYTVEGWGNLGTLLSVPTFVSAEAFVIFPTIYIIQLFFAFTVRKLNRNNWFAPTVVVFAATAAFIVGIIIAVRTSMNLLVSVFSTPYMETAIGLYTGLSAFSDIATTIFLTAWSVSSLKSCLGSTKDIVRNLITCFITRGFLLALVQLGTCITFFVLPSGLYWTPFHFCKGRMYVITMLSILNSRTSHKEMELRRTAHVFEVSIPQPVEGLGRDSNGTMVFASNTQASTRTGSAEV